MLMNKKIKILLKVFLSIFAIPVSISLLGVLFGIYNILILFVGMDPISLTPNPLNFLMNAIFIVAIFVVPGVFIWLIWKKI